MLEKIFNNPIDEAWYADPEARIYDGTYVIDPKFKSYKRLFDNFGLHFSLFLQTYNII